jgi:putative membrane-bound dehydrogenase-like protein
MNSRKAALTAVLSTGVAAAVIAGVFLTRPPARGNWIGVGESYTINVPPGFTIERVAAPENIQYPMMATVDDRGRLFVAESSGKNIKGKDMPDHPECRISLLEDVDGDGLYDKSKVFERDLSLPMGALWRDGSLYVASPPDFFRLDDKDGDGVAEHRETILTGWNILNTASLHGPFFGPDGRLYLTHGRHGYKIQTKEGAKLEGLAARIWRCHEDGSGLERVCGGGLDNPVEMIFTTAGEMIGTMTYFTDPQNGQRDGLLHYVEGGVYPKPHPVIAEFKRTGDLMPVMTKFARIAPSGLLQYRGTAFGPEYKGNLFTAQFNPHRIQRHILYREGATFRTEDSDFVTSTDPDFHPTDVIEDADGSMLFLDTGGWYVDACPLSKIAKSERMGAIYRVRKTEAARVKDPLGERLELESLPVAQLASYLADPRPMVRDRAVELLVGKKEAAVEALAAALAESNSIEAKCAAVFALGRIGSPIALEKARAGLSDRDFEARIAAARVAGMQKDQAALALLSRIVIEDQAPVRRQAATSLGQLGDPRAVLALVTAAANARDRFVEHAIIYSLIELQDRGPLLAALSAENAGVRKAALIALDQMDASPLRAEQATALLVDPDADLRRAALWVVSRHADWSSAALGFLRARLLAPKFDLDESQPLREMITAFAADPQVQTLVTETLAAPSTAAERRMFLIDAIERAPLKEMPAAWIDQISRLLASPDPRIRQRAIALIRVRRVAGLSEQLVGISLDPAEPADLRLAALSADLARNPKLSPAAFGFLLETLDPKQDPALRLSSAQSLGQAELDRNQLLSLARQRLAQADSLTLSSLLDAYRTSQDEEVGRALIAALENPAINLEAIGGKRIEQLFKNFPEQIHRSANKLMARFQTEEADRVRRLQSLEPLLTSGGDLGSGRNLFFGTRAACSTCHTVGKEGGHVGPDLTSIGSIRSGHDILEAIAFPNATFVPGHESRRVTTKTGGRIYSGVISEFESDREAIVLVSGPNDKIRIPRSDIASIESSNVSLMPDGFAAQLKDKEMADLLAYLQAQK